MTPREGPPFAAAALLLSAALAGSLLAEGGARVWENANASSYYRPQPIGSGAAGLELYRDSSEYGYEPISRLNGYNALGFRNPDYPARKGAATFRVMLTGDSLAASYGDALRERLESLMPEGRSLELWNVGVGGYGLAQYVRRLRDRGLRYQPDLVIVFHCLNDIDSNLPVLLKRRDGFVMARGMDGLSPQSLPGAGLLWTRSALYRLAVIGAVRRDRLFGPRPAPLHNEESARRELAALRADPRLRETPVVSVIFPLLIPETRYTPGWQRQGREAFPKLLSEAGIPFLDLGPLTPSDRRVSLRTDPADYIHMSDPAVRESMAVVARWLQRRALLPQARSRTSKTQ